MQLTHACLRPSINVNSVIAYDSGGYSFHTLKAITFVEDRNDCTQVTKHPIQASSFMH